MALTRAITSLFWVATAVYALLSAIPFASQHLLEPELVPAAAAFAKWHGWLSLAVLAVAAAALWPRLRAGDWHARVFIGLCAAGSLLATLTPGLHSLAPDTVALLVTLAALVPPVWLALLDGRGPAVQRPAAQSAVETDFAACLGASVAVAIAHAVGELIQGPIPDGWVVWTIRIAFLHLLAFAATFAGISVIRGVAGFSSRPLQTEAWLARGAFAAILSVIVHRVVLGPLSFSGGAAVIIACAFGAALALIVGPRGAATSSGLESALAACMPGWAARSSVAGCGWLGLAMSAAIAAERAVARSDWNLTIATLIAVTSWIVALATALHVVSHARLAIAVRPLRAAALFVVCALILVVSQTATIAGSWRDAPMPADVSSRLIANALTPTAPADSGLFELLQSHTNIPLAVEVAPVSVDFATMSGVPSPRRPHIFLFVIDSLRRDYLAPYNPAVAFTPALDRFAAESIVFERAFTRYGATGLAIPSIWVGGLVLHQQYPQPFAPMNALAKLLGAEGYQQWLTKEHIVETIVPPSAAINALDVGVPVKDHRFCRTVDEVRGRLSRIAESGAATFVYSLPQDVHVATITREGAAAVDGHAYGQFNAAYASRVRRLDSCFGAFVDDLKTRGLYDDSVIIITADHGDSLGEQGRMGHAYTIFPEIIQVPLIVHLPADLAVRFSSSPRSVAFTSDLAPTLYALLGHNPTPPAAIFGRPLFRPGAAASPERAGAQVIASSYGSVYGALLDDARRLFIVDAVSFREHAYELDGTGAGRAIPVRDDDREAAHHAIGAAVAEIAAFYRYRPGAN